MAGDLATTDDLQDMWRPLLDAELERAQNLISKASALLRQNTPRTPSLDDRILMFQTDPAAIQALDPVVVATVVATMVKRFVSNVEGATSTSETVGPYAKSMSFALRGDKDIRGELQVTENDLKALRPYLPKSRIGSIKVRPSMAPSPFGSYGATGLVIDTLLVEMGAGPIVVEAPVPIFRPWRVE